MQIRVFDSYSQLSEHAAAMVANLIERLPHPVLGLPTGGTPEGFYAALVRSGVDFSRVTSFNLDEYIGLPQTHPQSYATYMQSRLFAHVAMRPEAIHLPDGEAADPQAEAERYEAAIRRAGGMDLIILGLGHNGHIGFNEPGTPWESRTRPVTLDPATRQANARFFGAGERVPDRALTMGIGTIMAARQILLLASGEGKAEILRRALEGPPDPSVPASALQRHGGVTVMLDRAAAALLRQEVRL